MSDMPGAPRVLVVHRQRLVAEALAERLASEGLAARTETETDQLNIALWRPDFAPDLVVAGIDARMLSRISEPSRMVGDGSVTTLVLVEPDDVRSALRAMDAGAVGYAFTDESLDQLVATVRRALAGERPQDERHIELLRQRQQRDDPGARCPRPYGAGSDRGRGAGRVDRYRGAVGGRRQR